MLEHINRMKYYENCRTVLKTFLKNFHERPELGWHIRAVMICFCPTIDILQESLNITEKNLCDKVKDSFFLSVQKISHYGIPKPFEFFIANCSASLNSS